MNSQLSYSLAQAHRQELYRQAEQSRAAREASGPSRFAVLWHKLASARSIHGQLQTQPPARRPAAGGAVQI